MRLHSSDIGSTVQSYSWGTSMTRTLLVAALTFFGVADAVARPIFADFREELSWPYLFPDKPAFRIFEDLGEPVGGPDLTLADEIFNPSGSIFGAADLDLSGDGLITITGRVPEEANEWADYQRAVFTISNIVFNRNEIITGVSVLHGPGIFGEDQGAWYSQPIVSFTSNSVTIIYDIATGPDWYPDDWFDFADGASSTFKLEFSKPALVPEPGSLMLLGLAATGMAFRRWMRR
jgi:hypothetical protein